MYGHRALVVGVVGPRPALADPDAASARPQLTYAPDVATELREELAFHAYDPCAVATEPTAADLVTAIEDAVDGPGVAVVHVLTHGEVHDRTQGLHLVGGDGERTHLDIEDLLKLVERTKDDRRPLVLFILDVCHAGGAVWLGWQQLLNAEFRSTWVIAGSAADQLAYDGRLTRAVTAVLRDFREGRLRVDPSVRFIPLRNICWQVHQRVRGFGAPKQEIQTTRVWMHDNVDDVGFFANPAYRQHLRPAQLIEPAAAALLDEALDVRHFIGRASGAEVVYGPDTGRGFFWGRDREVAAVSNWLAAGGAAPRLQVVTGKPGVGKSALLGVLVCAAHPKLRDRMHALWSRLSTHPPLVPNLAVVHARQRTLDDITASLGRQWFPFGARYGPGIGTWTVDRLIDGLARLSSNDPPTAIVDALDEAERPEEVASALLGRLATGTNAAGGPLCKLLIGTRPERRFAPLLDLAQEGGGLLDLGATPRAELTRHLEAYAAQLLTHSPTYRFGATYQATGPLAAGMAETLTARAGDSSAGDINDHDWGEFLMCALYVRHVIDRPGETDANRARALGRAIPRELRDIVELDLVRRRDLPWLGPVLSVLAHAKGTGLPEEIVAQSAGAFAPDGVEPTLADVQAALDGARFYLRRDVDPEFGSTLYRLFHQGLADQIKARPCEYHAERRRRG
ncbi:hypothetical protein OG216_17040 [Streptomycetaceae bacterium NBC_01309]